MTHIIANVYCGHSAYDDDVWRLMPGGYTDSHGPLLGYDYAHLAVLFVLAGATVEPIGNTDGYAIVVEGDRERFISRLTPLLVAAGAA